MALIEYYGRECPHCHNMTPLIERLQKEGFKMERYEVWHEPANRDGYKKYDRGRCGGVPFFINTDTDAWLCGETDYPTFKDWAQGKPMKHEEQF